MAFLPATFLSVTFSREFPDSSWRIPVIVGSHLLAATVGVIRITPGYHFLTDVLAGAAIGSFFGWLIPTLHRRPLPVLQGEGYLSFHFMGNGAVMSVRF
jgi:membrane-associated phospholipid phosphatase